MPRLVLSLILALSAVTTHHGVSAAAFFRPKPKSSSNALLVRHATILSIKGGGKSKDDQATTTTKRPLTALDLAVAGSVSTMIGDIALHPIDCIKTLQQSNEGAGLSLLGASKKIMADSGPGGFYSGLGTYVSADGAAGALKFATYEALKQWVGDRIPEEYAGAALFGCAAAAYVASSVVLIPGELIKQRLQMGMVDSVGGAISSIWKTEGIRGFFAGSSGVWIRDVPYTMLELGIYDNVKALCLKLRKARSGEEDCTPTQADEIIAAAISGGITGYLTNPLDLVKTKLMVNADLYKGFFDAWRKTVQEGGIASLFNGAGARVSYIMPFCTFYLPVYEIFKRKLETCAPFGGSRHQGVAPIRGGAQVPVVRARSSKTSVRSEHPLRGDRCFVSF